MLCCADCKRSGFSAASAELVAVSSILVYDVYKRYINPNPTDKQIMFWTHVSCIFYGIVMACIGIIFYEIGISLGWLFGYARERGGATISIYLHRVAPLRPYGNDTS